MNGTISDAFVFDTNVVIDLLDDKLTSLPVGRRLISVVTRMELRAAASTARDELITNDFLNKALIIPLSSAVQEEAVRIRKFGKPRLKLPDAIIAASAVVFGATLLTSDEKMLKLEWDGLRTANPRMVDL